MLSSAMLSASFSYDNFAFLAWVSLIPYFIAITKSNMPSSMFLSWIEGILFFAGVTYWFTEYSYTFWFPILGILSIFFIFYGAVFNLIFRRVRLVPLRILLASSVWIAVEFFRHRTFLAFPWGVLGYSQHSYLSFMQVSKLTGILGVSLLIVLFNLCAAEFIIHINFFNMDGSRSGLKANRKLFKHTSFTALILVISILVINLISGYACLKIKDGREGGYTGEKLNVALVQPNISFDDKFETDTGVLIPKKTGEGGRYFAEGSELIVFPESVIWGYIERERNKTFYEWVKSTAGEENLYFMMGQILWDEKENYYNTVQLYDPQLEILGRYNKIHPLPCAEYMPYPEKLGFLSFLNIAKTNITPSREFILIGYPGKGRIGTNICFESTLGVISRTYRKMGADILFTFTDTAGFKDSIVAWHHLIFSRVRAIENGSFMVHSGNNGISAIIDPFGRILARTDLVKKDVLYGTVYFNDKKTFYSDYGELLIYIYFGVVAGFLIVYLLRNFCKKPGKNK
ncbi:MAG: apolipoprotein N-acyltransferase [Actinobacteria bacterium]|nr:apolipoprotein N-acyltransferase [Actinomycetota bacterium]